jgi:methionyl-tRNA formyltransferase
VWTEPNGGVVVTELNVVLAGQESAGIRALQLVVERGHRIAAVLTDPSREPSGTSSVAATAFRLGVAVRDAALVRTSELGSWLRAESVDLLLNVHSLYVAAEAVVEAPRIGSFNLHPGPLPGYPGLNAPSWGIYEGRDVFGCTIHWMDAAIDAGPIAYAATFPIGERETGLTLTARCVREGLELLRTLLDDAGLGRTAIPRIEQRGVRVERGAGPPHDGRVPWSYSAARIAAFVRACDYGPFRSPWGKPRAAIDGRDVSLLLASSIAGLSAGDARPGEIVDVVEDDVLVATGDGSVLRIARLEHDGEVIPPATLAQAGARFSA